MSIFNPGDLTFNGQELQSIGEVLQQRTFNNPAVTEFHDLLTGISQKRQFAFGGRLGLIGEELTSCNPSGTQENTTTTEKFIDPKQIHIRHYECFTDLEDSVALYASNNAIARPDLTGTEYANYVIDMLDPAINDALYRLVYFNDLNAALADASPAGVITPGTDLKYFNVLDGFWPQLYDIVASDADRRVTIAKNSQTNWDDQQFDSTDTDNLVVTNDVLANLKYNADIRLRNADNQVMIVTQTVFDQYAKELRSRDLDQSFIRIEGGYNALEFEGIQVVSMNVWDRIIADYFKDSSSTDSSVYSLYQPHRAIYTTRDNLLVTLDATEGLDVESWYDQKEMRTYFDVLFRVDALVKEDYMVQVAY